MLAASRASSVLLTVPSRFQSHNPLSVSEESRLGRWFLGDSGMAGLVVSETWGFGCRSNGHMASVRCLLPTDLLEASSQVGECMSFPWPLW